VINDLKAEEAQKLLSQLTKAVFWNCDLDKFDYARDKKYIIERIIEAGLENDEIIMWKLYSYDDIKNVALKMEYLEDDIVTYMAFVLKMKESDFKCYNLNKKYYSALLNTSGWLITKLEDMPFLLNEQ
jgi:hypothetical protein